jgi:hypothetical protein
MLKLNLILAYYMYIALLAGITGCESTGYGDWGPASDVITVALPYVEAVHIPSEIHTGQSFTITVDISCDSNPGAMRSPARPFPTADNRTSGHYSADGKLVYTTVIKPYRDLTQVSSSLPVVSSVVYDFESFPAGEHKLYYISALTRGQGGLSISYDRQTQSEMEYMLLYSKLLELTVLP